MHLAGSATHRRPARAPPLLPRGTQSGVLAEDQFRVTHPDFSELKLPIAYFKMAEADLAWAMFQDMDVNLPPAFAMFPDLECLEICYFKDEYDPDDVAAFRAGLVHALKRCARLRTILLADEEQFAVVLPIRRHLPGVTIGLRPSRARPSMHPITELNTPARAGIENYAETVREDLRYTW